MIRLHAPTGMLLDLVSKRKVKLPLTPSPLASLQICRRPLGLEVGVGEPFGVLVGVAVGAPCFALVKITSVTPVPILPITFPMVLSWLTVRVLGRTSIFVTE